MHHTHVRIPWYACGLLSEIDMDWCIKWALKTKSKYFQQEGKYVLFCWYILYFTTLIMAWFILDPWWCYIAWGRCLLGSSMALPNRALCGAFDAGSHLGMLNLRNRSWTKNTIKVFPSTFGLVTSASFVHHNLSLSLNNAPLNATNSQPSQKAVWSQIIMPAGRLLCT